MSYFDEYAVRVFRGETDRITPTTAEILGFGLSLHSVYSRCTKGSSVTVYTDCHNVKNFLENAARRTPNNFFDEEIVLLNAIQVFIDEDISVKLCYSPAHCGEPGNEFADSLAGFGRCTLNRRS